MDSSSPSTARSGVNRETSSSTEDDGALPVTAGLAKEAGVLFQSGKFADCVKVLNQLLQKKENDLKVLHNIAIAENFQDGYSDPKRLLEVLNNVKKRNEDHVRASAEQVEPVSNLGSKAITGSKASNSVGNQLFAPNSSPAVYTDDFDSSVATYNIAVTWFYLHEHEKAFSILEPLYQNIEPIDEGTALRICLLLLDVALLSRHASRSADVISYIEKVFCFNGLISQGDNGSSVQQQSSTMMLKSSAVPSNSTIPDTSSNLDSLASANASEIPLTRTLSEETLEYDFLSLDISSQNLPRPSPLQSSNKTQADEYISTNDLRLKLHFYKVRFLLLTRNLKAAKREVKMAMNVAQGKDYSIALFLKSQLEYARGNHRKAIKLLMASSNRSESGILSMYYNNLGCIYFGLGKHHTSSLFFSKALNSGLSLRKEKPLKLTTVLEDKSNLIIYNCGIQYLACGKPLLAFRCFYKAGLVFYNRPLLWLRIAECCLMALEKGLIKSSFCPSKVSDIKASVIGKGKWRQLGIEDGILKNGEDLFLGDEKKQHNLSISLAKQCLNNALHLLNCSDTKYTELGSFSNAKAEEIESKEAVHANGEAKEQKGREQKGGNSVTFSSSLMSSISEYEDIHRRENHMTKQSVLADLAYVELELGNPLKALSMARTLLKLPECSGIFLFLGNVYAAEALCLLNRLVEAAEYLSIYLSSENEIKLPFSQDNYEQWTSLEKAAESEETNGRPLRGNLDDSSRKLGFLSPEEARGTLYANLAATSAIQGDLEQARRFVVQASSLISDSPQAIMTEIYIEIRLGNTKEAVARLKRYNHIRFVPGNLELDGSSSSSL